jgi:hypothetical protein
MLKTKSIKESAKKTLGIMALFAIMVSTSGVMPLAVMADTDPSTVVISIEKYIEGQKATVESVRNTDFTMNASWSAENIGAGSGQYALGAGNSYATETIKMSLGANYSTEEVVDGVTVGVCDTAAFSLVGYSVGDTLAEAEAASPTLTAPTFTGLTTDKVVIVWNDDCTVVTPPATTVKVHIAKFVDGTPATDVTAQNKAFGMNASWDDSVLGAGAGTYTLDSSNVYATATTDMQIDSSYATSEVMDGVVVGANCDATNAFALGGYSSGNTYAEALAAPKSMTSPSFTHLMTDKTVIVWNDTCEPSTSGGTVGGTVTGGSSSTGVLAVTGITTEKGTATADGSFENGWKYTFNITIPTDESHLSMKFADWVNASLNTIGVANNLRISSAQADNGGSTVLITAADTYSAPVLNMTTDLDALTLGKQVQVVIEVAVPVNSVNGAYTTSYGIKTE